MVRKLASIQKICAITPIENMDKVETATVLGWNCIVQKDEFKVGDYCVYIEPDSVLYPHPVWDSFLAKRKYKIKTIKMCGTISQGLILPVNIINKIKPEANVKIEEGFDLTDTLSVTHYEKGKLSDYNDSSERKVKNKFIKFMMKFEWFRKTYLFLFGLKSKGEFPSDVISKTDETNIQAIPNIIKQNIGKRFYITEKLEGQSSTYMIQPKHGFLNRILKRNEFTVCSHNIKISHPDNSSWWTIARKLDIENKLRNYYTKNGIYLAIQGEIIGPNIQGNIYNLNDYEFFIFNVKNLNTNTYMNMEEKLKVCEDLNLNIVPILDYHFVIEENMNPQYLLKISDGISVLNNTKREGLVIRSYENDTISFKVRSPEYLLKEK